MKNIYDTSQRRPLGYSIFKQTIFNFSSPKELRQENNFHCNEINAILICIRIFIVRRVEEFLLVFIIFIFY